jgi:hypothetical protein
MAFELLTGLLGQKSDLADHVCDSLPAALPYLEGALGSGLG